MHLTGFFKHRAILIIPPLLLPLLWPRAESGIGEAYFVAGLIVFFVGVLGRIWAQEHLHFRLKMPVTLTTTGPYALVRNPIYIFNTLICVGLTLLSGNWIFVAITLVWCMVLYTLVVREEEEHTKQYGEAVEAYYREVSRWIPMYRGKPLAMTNEFLVPSIWAELHNFLLLLPFLIKKLIFGFV